MKRITFFLISFSLFSSSIAQEFNGNRKFNGTDYSSLSNPNFKQKSKTYFNQLGEGFKVDSVYLYGGGKLFSLLTSDEEIESTNTSGSLGLFFQSTRMRMNFFFTYNGKNNVEMQNLKQFGLAITNPDRSGQSLSLSTEFTLTKKIGFLMKGYVGDQNWILDSTTSQDASPLVAKFGFLFRPFEFELNDNDIDINLELAYTYRGILGDFGNQKTYQIGTDILQRQGFNGFEFTLNAALNSVKLFVTYTANGNNELYIPGFSGNQIFFGVNVTGQMVKLK